ncbi:MAG: hypothetical protein AVDCRST_MAG56-6710, partial [uncultured Cytophagales bacterium]
EVVPVGEGSRKAGLHAGRVNRFAVGAFGHDPVLAELKLAAHGQGLETFAVELHERAAVLALDGEFHLVAHAQGHVFHQEHLHGGGAFDAQQAEGDLGGAEGDPPLGKGHFHGHERVHPGSLGGEGHVLDGNDV